MKQKKILGKATNIVPAILMAFFSIPKLLGGEEVKQGFQQLISLVPIDIDTFRVITGIVELSIAILLVLYTVKNNAVFGKIGFFLLFVTMVGALTMEFFARPEPMMMMVVIAIFLFIIAVFKLIQLIKK